jgi:hypothetical protein
MMKERLEQFIMDIEKGCQTYREVYPDAWIPDFGYNSMDAKIEGILNDCIEITDQYEKPACGRGCCGYETVYEKLYLPLACIDNPEKWIAEETQAVKEATEARKLAETQAAKEATRKKAEKAEAARIAKEEKEKKQLAELKAKYENA